MFVWLCTVDSNKWEILVTPFGIILMRGCVIDYCRQWSVEGGLGPWHLFDEAALWILPSGLNLETVKCKEKNSETSFTYQGLQFVCHLVDLLLNSKLTCFNSIQSAKLCKKRGKWFCFLFEALNSENIVMKIKNK